MCARPPGAVHTTVSSYFILHTEKEFNVWKLTYMQASNSSRSAKHIYKAHWRNVKDIYTPDNIVVLRLLNRYRIITLGSHWRNYNSVQITQLNVCTGVRISLSLYVYNSILLVANCPPLFHVFPISHYIQKFLK